MKVQDYFLIVMVDIVRCYTATLDMITAPRWAGLTIKYELCSKLYLHFKCYLIVTDLGISCDSLKRGQGQKIKQHLEHYQLRSDLYLIIKETKSGLLVKS